MKILLLVQEIKNRSVQLLTEALQEKLVEQQLEGEVLVWEIKDVECSDEQPFISNGKERIALSDISLAVKRTWGPIRTRGLEICRSLEKRGVSILNGCDFIQWSHSKIQQYRSMQLQKKKHLYPETICISSETINRFVENSTQEFIAYYLLEECYPNHQFPMVLKKDQGSRTDGVYLIESLEALQALLMQDQESLRKGFLLQAFIRSHEKSEISNYFRLNIVDGKVQSVVQFQMLWKKMEVGPALKLSEFKEAQDLPIDVNIFPEHKLQEIVSACHYSQDTVGIDVMFDGKQMYLLEHNDGPAISHVFDIGQQYLHSELPVQAQAAQACYDFTHAIAAVCVERALKCVPVKDKSISTAFQNSRAASNEGQGRSQGEGKRNNLLFNL